MKSKFFEIIFSGKVFSNKFEFLFRFENVEKLKGNK